MVPDWLSLDERSERGKLLDTGWQDQPLHQEPGGGVARAGELSEKSSGGEGWQTQQWQRKLTDSHETDFLHYGMEIHSRWTSLNLGFLNWSCSSKKKKISRLKNSNSFKDVNVDGFTKKWNLAFLKADIRSMQSKVVTFLRFLFIFHISMESAVQDRIKPCSEKVF